MHVEWPQLPRLSGISSRIVRSKRWQDRHMHPKSSCKLFDICDNNSRGARRSQMRLVFYHEVGQFENTSGSCKNENMRNHMMVVIRSTFIKFAWHMHSFPSAKRSLDGVRGTSEMRVGLGFEIYILGKFVFWGRKFPLWTNCYSKLFFGVKTFTRPKTVETLRRKFAQVGRKCVCARARSQPD